MQNVTNIINDTHFSDEEIVIHTLCTTKCTKEVAIALKAHQSMRDYESDYDIIVHIIFGALHVTIDTHHYILGSGDMIQIAKNKKHNVTAQEDTLLRVTLLDGVKI